MKEKKDIISLGDFSKQEILSILDIASKFEDHAQYGDLLKGNIIATMFLEPSTRTRLSFVSAAQRLGAEVLTYESSVGTSQLKGETLFDTIKMMDYYSDLIVLRHPNDGAARFVSEISSLPIINAGDGSNQHPTQTLLDLYTIQKKFKTLNNLKIGFVGDLKYGRTVHSLSQALSLFNSTLYFISPDILKLPSYIQAKIEKTDSKVTLLSDYKDVLPELDVLYVTRIQKERFLDEMDYEKVKGAYLIKKDDLEPCKDSFIMMHPLPRVDEISPDIDHTPHAYYFQQALNGVCVRKALLALCLNKVPN